MTQNLRDDIDGLVHKLLRTLSEIQSILYLGDDFRTPNEILRLHNNCFAHFALIKKIMPIGLSSKLTCDKLFGKYMHNLLVHAPIQYRTVGRASINREDEVRIYWSMLLYNTERLVGCLLIMKMRSVFLKISLTQQLITNQGM